MRNVIVAVLIFGRRRAMTSCWRNVLRKYKLCKVNVLRFDARRASKCFHPLGTYPVES